MTDGPLDFAYEAAAAKARAHWARLEEACEESLTDPDGRGVLVVRDPATGELVVSLDASVPFGTIHSYPHGRDT